VGCDRLIYFARLQYVHAGFGESEVGFDVFRLAIEEFRGCAEEEDDSGCEGPVDPMNVSS
jgi:hypothetical protein